MVINMVLYNNILIIICFYIALYVSLTLSSLFHSNGQRARRYDPVNTVSGVPCRFQCMSLVFHSISVRKNVAMWTIGNGPKMISNWNNYDFRIEQWKSTAEYSEQLDIKNERTPSHCLKAQFEHVFVTLFRVLVVLTVVLNATESSSKCTGTNWFLC